MTDDLVKRLREEDIYDYADANKLCNEAADRIEQLEAALRWYADVCISDVKMSRHLMGPSGDYGDKALAALGEKKDD